MILFWLLVKLLLFIICNNNVKICGFVFLILLNRMIEYGLWCIFLVNVFELLL